jgi:RNA polymerase sigma factor (TIGR02999 family)
VSDVTRILNAIEQGDSQAAAQLLPLVYDELRRLAAARMANEAPGHTLDATGLVHEAYLRMLGERRDSPPPEFANRAHFFAAAAEAMRRILVDRARAKATVKRGGDRQRLELDNIPAADANTELLDLDAALTELESHDEPAARLVKLRYFAGLSHQEAADALGVTRRAADRLWALARAWLKQRLAE